MENFSLYIRCAIFPLIYTLVVYRIIQSSPFLTFLTLIDYSNYKRNVPMCKIVVAPIFSVVKFNGFWLLLFGFMSICQFVMCLLLLEPGWTIKGNGNRWNTQEMTKVLTGMRLDVNIHVPFIRCLNKPNKII